MAAPATGTDSPYATPGSGGQGDAPLFMTTMTHMEGLFDDDVDQNVFENHVQQLRFGMDLAEAYGAILTIETEKPFALANTSWGYNMMAEILDRGHGVGTHCDFGFQDPLMPVAQYAQFFAENKALVDALVGPGKNLGCSGGGSVNDWAVAASQAGFKYLDGIVSMHYLSMPMENRPGMQWTDSFIHSGNHHYNAPLDLYQRIYPFMVADAQDFVADENGVILVSSGELGNFSMMAEGSAEWGGLKCAGECPLNNDDVDALVALILEVDQNRDRSRLAKLAIYLPAGVFISENEAVLRYLFEQVSLLAQRGIITWASQKHVYDAYVDWNR